MKQQLSKVQQVAQMHQGKKCSVKHHMAAMFIIFGLVLCGVMLGLCIGTPRNNGADAPSRPGATATAALPDEPCAAIEILVARDLIPDDIINTSTDYNDHLVQAELYTRMAKNGCPENSEKYAAKAAYHTQIAKGLNPYAQETHGVSDDAPTCAKIESTLQDRIWYDINNANEYLHNAEIYATLAERGCPEHATDYKAKAVQMIDIATALQPEKDMGNHDIESIVETYSKMNMKAKANEFLNKIQKLTDPAIEFIYQMQQIINE